MSKEREIYYCRYRVKNPGDEIWTVSDVEFEATSKTEAQDILISEHLSKLHPDSQWEIKWVSTDYMFPF